MPTLACPNQSGAEHVSGVLADDCADGVQVEKAWAEVAATFPPPLYRHRYGT